MSEFNGIGQHFQKIADSILKFVVGLTGNIGTHKPSEVKSQMQSNNVKMTKKMSTENIVSRACFWDINRFKYQGKTLVNFKQLSLGVLTGTVPQHKDCLRMNLEALNISHFSTEINCLLTGFSVQRISYKATMSNPAPAKIDIQQTLMKIPLIEISCILNWNATNNYLFFLASREHQLLLADNFIARSLDIDFKCHLPRVADRIHKTIQCGSVEEIVINSEVPIFHYEANIFNDLINLPQLRHEYLRQHGIKPSSYKEKGSEADKALNKQKVAVCSNYMELITYTLNQALNNKEENLIKFVSQVALKLHTTSIRMIASNRDTSTRILRQLGDEFKELEESCIVIGMQSVIESITYSSTFFKKKLKAMNVETQQLDEPKEDMTESSKVQSEGAMIVWDVKDGRGQLNCLVVGYLYRSFSLIKFDEAALVAYKKSIISTSMDNKQLFFNFFGLKKYSGTESAENSPNTCTNALALFNHDKLEIELQNINSPLSYLSPNFLSPGLINLCSGQIFNFVNSVKLTPRLTPKDEKPEKTLENSIMDFDQHEVFFSTKLIMYELAKQRELTEISGPDLTDESSREAKFDHFITMFDSKICVIYSIFKVITALLDIKNEKNVNRKKMKDKQDMFTAEQSEMADGAFKTTEDIKWKGEEQQNEEMRRRSMIEVNEIQIIKEKQRKAQLYTNTSYPFGILIMKPQFNFNDYLNFSQTIFTSSEECFIYLQKDTLKYDYFSMDPRFKNKIIFKDLEVFNGRPSFT